jgi:hypothetical protein
MTIRTQNCFQQFSSCRHAQHGRWLQKLAGAWGEQKLRETQSQQQQRERGALFQKPVHQKEKAV